jgi:hypothetical protein
MKKTYMNPTLEVVVLKYNNSLLAGSPGLMGDEINPSVIESREYDFDDEEEY